MSKMSPINKLLRKKTPTFEDSSLVDAMEASTENCRKLICISSTTHFARAMGLRVAFLENRSSRVAFL